MEVGCSRLRLTPLRGGRFALKVVELFHGQAVEEFDTPLDSKGGLQELVVIVLIGAFKPCWIFKAPVGCNGRARERRALLVRIVTNGDDEI